MYGGIFNLPCLLANVVQSYVKWLGYKQKKVQFLFKKSILDKN